MKEPLRFYMVREDILPDSILKTALAKEMLASGEASNINEAVDRLGIARSTYYKYKEGIFPLFDADNARIINVSLQLKHISGVLSGVLNCIAGVKGNVLTINQNLPLHGMAYVTLSVSLEEMTVSTEELLHTLSGLDGVISVQIVGRS